MTRKQLEAKREEFWHTAVEGKRHVWDALQAAVQAPDDDEALSLIAAVGVSLPKNSFTEAYDESGVKYVIPLFCLTDPINLLADDDSAAASDEGADAGGDGGSDDGEERPLKLRLSDGALDLKWTVRTTHTVAALRRRLDEDENTAGRRPRFFYAGKQLHDKCVLSYDTIPANHVLQVSILPRETPQQE